MLNHRPRYIEVYDYTQQTIYTSQLGRQEEFDQRKAAEGNFQAPVAGHEKHARHSQL